MAYEFTRKTDGVDDVLVSGHPLAANAAAGRENNATGKAIAIGIISSPVCIQISLYDATTVWVNTYNPQAGLFYRII